MSKHRWRQHLHNKSQESLRNDWVGFWKFSEFFYCYLKYIDSSLWQGAKCTQSKNITYLLETHDDWATAPPKLKMSVWGNRYANQNIKNKRSGKFNLSF